MRMLPIVAGLFGLLVVLSEVQWVGRTALWLPLMVLGIAVILLAGAVVHLWRRE